MKQSQRWGETDPTVHGSGEARDRAADSHGERTKHGDLGKTRLFIWKGSGGCSRITGVGADLSVPADSSPSHTSTSVHSFHRLRRGQGPQGAFGSVFIPSTTWGAQTAETKSDSALLSPPGLAGALLSLRIVCGLSSPGLSRSMSCRAGKQGHESCYCLSFILFPGHALLSCLAGGHSGGSRGWPGTSSWDFRASSISFPPPHAEEASKPWWVRNLCDWHQSP